MDNSGYLWSDSSGFLDNVRLGLSSLAAVSLQVTASRPGTFDKVFDDQSIFDIGFHDVLGSGLDMVVDGFDGVLV